jgi:hypothetical protein
MTATRWAYLAGLVEGEGCFFLGGPADKIKAFLKIRMTDRVVIEDINTDWPGQVISIEPPAGVRSAVYEWRVNRRAVLLEIIDGILPYMVGSKRDQAIHFRDFLLLQIVLVTQAKTEKRRLTSQDRLLLLRQAMKTRLFAQGGSKEWYALWVTEIARLEATT